MYLLRLILITGMLLHPFCFHCFAEMQAMAEGAECAVETEVGPADESSQSGAVCTKSPLRAEIGWNWNLFLQCDLVLALPTFSGENIRLRTDAASFTGEYQRPLYLSLAVLLI